VDCDRAFSSFVIRQLGASDGTPLSVGLKALMPSVRMVHPRAPVARYPNFILLATSSAVGRQSIVQIQSINDFRASGYLVTSKSGCC